MNFPVFFLRMGVCWLLLSGSRVLAQEGQPFEVHFDDLTPVKVSADDQAVIHFKIVVPPKHHLYREVLEVRLNRAVSSQELVTPQGKRHFDEFMGKETEVYEEGEYNVDLKVTLPKNFDLTQPFSGTFVYQGCSDKICFRAVKKTFAFVLYHPSAQSVAGAPAAPPAKSMAEDKPSFWQLLKSGDFREVLGQGLPMALLITFLAGLATAFTPCVLPVVPLTLAFMGLSQGTTRRERFLALLVFTGGVCVMYATLGVGSALIGQTLGFQFQNPVFLSVLTVVFILMGLWMLGVINFHMPARLQTAIAGVQPKGLMRHVYAGLTVGFLAAPCVGPIVGPLLVYIASTRDVGIGAAMMVSYALGLSVLFILLAFASRDWIARFGRKSLWLKRALGVLIIATGLFYGSVLLTPFWSAQAHSSDFFTADLQAAEKRAGVAKTGVMIDFFAEWCLPCHEWDDGAWSDPKVQQAVKDRYIPVKIDCTTETPACEAAVQRFGVIGWPTIIFLGPDGKEEVSKRLVGRVLSPEEFLRHVGAIR